MEVDVIVIGSGPGGYSAACLCAKNGLKTVIIEKDKLGGVCLNIGCIPTKALINIASTIEKLMSDNEIFNIKKMDIDLEKISLKVKNIADTVSKQVEFLLNTNKVKIIKGNCMFIDDKTVKVGEETIKGKYIIIATGSRNKDISNYYFNEIDKTKILTSTEAIFFKEKPTNIVILGGGAIGVEFAYIFNQFAFDVTILEYFPNLIPSLDMELSRTLERSFKKNNIKILCNSKVIKIEYKNNELITTYETNGQSETINSNLILNSLGRTPNTDIDGIEKLNLVIEKGFIKVNENMQTNIKNIYAIGDIVFNSPLLAHVAYEEAKVASESIIGKIHTSNIDYLKVPYCIYTEPQIASFGINEEQAKIKGINYKSIKSFYKSSGKAVALEKTEGFIKLLIDINNETILGAHIAGAEATELIHELLLAGKTQLKLKAIASTMHAHPTLSELIMDSAKSFYGLGLH